MLIHWHKSPGYFWFHVFGYGVHAKRIPADGYELFSLRGKPHRDCCGWRFRWLTRSN